VETDQENMGGGINFANTLLTLGSYSMIFFEPIKTKLPYNIPYSPPGLVEQIL
jgi:hypothetical protein